jgi:hypothetical protein
MVTTLLVSASGHAPAAAQDSPDVGVLSEALSIGVDIDGSCDYAQATAALDAWEYLAIEIRTSEQLYSHVFNCVLNARIVEADCATQTDRSAIQRALLEDDYHWQFECVDFPPGQDMNGNPTQTLADAHINISGAKMRLDKSFLSSSSKEYIAGTMAHELMHNRGFTHSANDFGSVLYSMTVPEQVATCVSTAGTTANPNPRPYPDYWDRELCCEGQGFRFCDSRGCYTMTGNVCMPVDDSLPDIGYNYCGLFIQHEVGAAINPFDPAFPDAGMCGFSTTVPQGNVAGP